jgi:hypothetical protein
MKMIRNKSEVASSWSLLIFLISLALIGAARGSCNAADSARSGTILQRFGTPPCSTMLARALTLPTSLAHQWLRVPKHAHPPQAIAA